MVTSADVSLYPSIISYKLVKGSVLGMEVSYFRFLFADGR